MTYHTNQIQHVTGAHQSPFRNFRNDFSWLLMARCPTSYSFPNKNSVNSVNSKAEKVSITWIKFRKLFKPVNLALGFSPKLTSALRKILIWPTLKAGLAGRLNFLTRNFNWPRVTGNKYINCINFVPPSKVAFYFASSKMHFLHYISLRETTRSGRSSNFSGQGDNHHNDITRHTYELSTRVSKFDSLVAQVVTLLQN